ncbi:MAG: CDP-glycerol glycerophosphotransferase family protein [Simkaniaceae bacterium]|nr:CDP-glycerol glycerophosphotransferase family protein [Simkaniaceae bacterium]
MRIYGLLFGPNEHHLDHIATLCSIIDIPLICTEERLEKMARRYYPSLTTQLILPNALGQKVLELSDALITCLPHALIDEILFLPQLLEQRKILSVFCHHGNSEKNMQPASLELLAQEKILLYYGQKLIEALKENKLYHQVGHLIGTGNFRLDYYNRMKPYYKQIADEKIFSKFENKKTLLFAPTWQEEEKASAILPKTIEIIEKIPKNTNLIVKYHPNTWNRLKFELEVLEEKYSDQQNVQFLRDFPLIYPILDRVDLFLGDASSVGYDFLVYNRPLLFLNFSAPFGQTVTENLTQAISQALETGAPEYAEKRQAAYTYAFENPTCPDQLKWAIHGAIKEELEA